MVDELTYPFSNLDGCTIEILEWIGNLTPHVIVYVIIIYTRGD